MSKFAPELFMADKLKVKCRSERAAACGPDF